MGQDLGVTAASALPGRQTALAIDPRHALFGGSMLPPFAEHLESLVVAMGCFWGVERKFWQLPGVVMTAVGYAGGFTPNPTYDEVCTGLTGHTEVALVVFDPSQISLEQLLQVFWESHNPTQGMRQGNDIGSQYRSAIYTQSAAQLQLALATRDKFQVALTRAGLGEITTEITPLTTFYYAETYHQQYLHKQPYGYCGLRGTGVCLT